MLGFFKALADTGLTPRDLLVMAAVDRAPDRSVRDLAQETGIGRSSVTRHLDALASRNLVSKHDDANDRRLVRVRSSREAKGLLRKLTAEARRAVAHD